MVFEVWRFFDTFSFFSVLSMTNAINDRHLSTTDAINDRLSTMNGKLMKNYPCWVKMATFYMKFQSKIIPGNFRAKIKISDDGRTGRMFWLSTAQIVNGAHENRACLKVQNFV